MTPLIYGSLDGILLPLEDVEALSVGERETLWEYVKSGGSLAVAGGGKLPDEWKRLDARLENRILKNGGMARVRNRIRAALFDAAAPANSRNSA